MEKKLLDILLDPDNKEPISLINESGDVLKFKQICVLPYNNSVYCLLAPLFKAYNLSEDEVIVFRVTDDFDNIVPELNEEVALCVYNKYLELLNEAIGG